MKTSKQPIEKQLFEKFYYINTICHNCGTEDLICIPFGISVNSMPCDLCGCLTLTKKV
jgi:hypothetical protein